MWCYKKKSMPYRKNIATTNRIADERAITLTKDAALTEFPLCQRRKSNSATQEIMFPMAF